jgi:hypothetical protein
MAGNDENKRLKHQPNGIIKPNQTSELFNRLTHIVQSVIVLSPFGQGIKNLLTDNIRGRVGAFQNPDLRIDIRDIKPLSKV